MTCCLEGGELGQPVVLFSPNAWEPGSCRCKFHPQADESKGPPQDVTGRGRKGASPPSSASALCRPPCWRPIHTGKGSLLSGNRHSHSLPACLMMTWKSCSMEKCCSGDAGAVRYNVLVCTKSTLKYLRFWDQIRSPSSDSVEITSSRYHS
jgi:hypothetical protein